MTEYEKIAYAKSFIDKLANGVNPLDDTPIPDDDIVNNVRLSRCFFYVSSILQREIERERKKLSKEMRGDRLPFSITSEQLEGFEYSQAPISVSAMAQKINWLVREDIEGMRIKKLSYPNTPKVARSNLSQQGYVQKGVEACFQHLFYKTNLFIPSPPAV